MFIICSQKGTTILVSVCTCLYPRFEKYRQKVQTYQILTEEGLSETLTSVARVSNLLSLTLNNTHTQGFSLKRQAVPSVGGNQPKTLFTALPYICARSIDIGRIVGTLVSAKRLSTFSYNSPNHLTAHSAKPSLPIRCGCLFNIPISAV